MSDTTTHPRPAGADDPDRPTGPAHSDAEAWVTGGAGTGDTGRNNGLRVAAAVVLTALALRFMGLAGLAIIVALLVSVVLHEAGHFWGAKACGMKATEFFVGVGPRIFSFRRGETEYGAKAIPIAAYVKIIGMNQFEEVDPADEARTYRQQGTFKRIAVVAAGPAMNLVIAFVLFAVFFASQGRVLDTWTIRAVESGSSADLAGLQAGDQILSVAGEPVGSFNDFSPQLAAKAGTQVDMVVQRDGEQITVPVDLGWRLSADAAAAFPSVPKLQRSDVIEAVTIAGGEPVELTSYDQLRTVLAEPGPAATLRIERGGHPYDLVVQRPDTSLPADGSAGFLGVRPEQQVEELGVLAAAGESARTMGMGVTSTASAFGRLVTPSGIADLYGQLGDATAEKGSTATVGDPGALTPVGDSPPPGELVALSEDRPVSIIGAAFLGADAANAGWGAFFLVVAGVNLALGLLNLIPMLPLDGGHIAIAAYEGIRGRIRGQRYVADVTKLMPVVYAFIAVLAVIAIPTLLLDILQRPSLR